MNQDDKGYYQRLAGTSLLNDPETYVDTGFSLNKLIQESFDSMQSLIWKHIDANRSTDYYYVWQEFWLRPKADPRKIYLNGTRDFSFLGLYRKFSEADLFELMRLQELTRKKRNIKTLDIDSLFCNFYGNNIFSIFYNDVKVLQEIVDWLNSTEHPMQEFDDIELPH